MRAFFGENKVVIIIAIVVILVLVGIGVAIWFGGKKAGDVQGVANNKISVNNELTDGQKSAVKDYANRLFEDVNSWYGSMWRDNKLYETLAGVPDNVLVAVYQQYKIDHDGADIRGEMEGEAYYGDTYEHAQTIINRLNGLLNK